MTIRKKIKCQSRKFFCVKEENGEEIVRKLISRTFNMLKTCKVEFMGSSPMLNNKKNMGDIE